MSEQKKLSVEQFQKLDSLMGDISDRVRGLNRLRESVIEAEKRVSQEEESFQEKSKELFEFWRNSEIELPGEIEHYSWVFNFDSVHELVLIRECPNSIWSLEPQPLKDERSARVAEREGAK